MKTQHRWRGPRGAGGPNLQNWQPGPWRWSITLAVVDALQAGYSGGVDEIEMRQVSDEDLDEAQSVEVNHAAAFGGDE